MVIDEVNRWVKRGRNGYGYSDQVRDHGLDRLGTNSSLAFPSLHGRLMLNAQS